MFPARWEVDFLHQLDESHASGEIQPYLRWNLADMLDIGISAPLLQSCHISGFAPTPRWICHVMERGKEGGETSGPR